MIFEVCRVRRACRWWCDGLFLCQIPSNSACRAEPKFLCGRFVVVLPFSLGCPKDIIGL